MRSAAKEERWEGEEEGVGNDGAVRYLRKMKEGRKKEGKIKQKSESRYVFKIVNDMDEA